MGLRTTLTLMLLAGATHAANAQEMRFLLEASQTIVTLDEPAITIGVYAEWTGDFTGFAGAFFDLRGVVNWETGAVTDFGGEFFADDIEDDEGQLLANNDIVEINPAQLPPLFNPYFDGSNPLHIFTVEWVTTDFTPREVCVETVPFDGLVYIDDFGSAQSLSVIGDSLCFDVASGNCPGDFNSDGRKNTRDVLDFLNAWTAGDRRADWNGDGTIDTRDVLGFLNDWITPC